MLSIRSGRATETSGATCSSPAAIHTWTELDADEREAVAPGYPAPTVDHAGRRDAALATFRRARGEDPS